MLQLYRTCRPGLSSVFVGSRSRFCATSDRNLPVMNTASQDVNVDADGKRAVECGSLAVPKHRNPAGHAYHYKRIKFPSVFMQQNSWRMSSLRVYTQRSSHGNRAPCRWGAYGPKVATNTASGIYVNSTFDSGNMDIVDIQADGTVQLAIHHDPYCESDGREHFQWCENRPPSFPFPLVNQSSCSVNIKVRQSQFGSWAQVFL